MHKTLLFIIIFFILVRCITLFTCINIIHDIDTTEFDHAKLAYNMPPFCNLVTIWKFIFSFLCSEDVLKFQIDDPKAGGAVVTALLYYFPFAYFFGGSYIALKFVPLAFSLVTLILWYLFLSKRFGNTISLIFSLFYIFPSIGLLKWTLTVWGSHPESALFFILIIYLFTNIIYGEYRKKYIILAIFGLVSGFSLYFSYFCLIPILTCGFIFIFQKENKFSLKEILIFVVFFILGFSPWLRFNFYSGFNGLAVEPYKVYEINLSNFFMRLKDFFINKPIFPPLFPITFLKNAYIVNIISNLFRFTYLVSLVYLLFLLYYTEVKKKKIAILTILLTIFFFILATVVSKRTSAFGLDMRYFAPLFPFVYACIAIFFGDIINRLREAPSLAHWRFLCYVVLVVLLGLSVRDSIKLISLGNKNIKAVFQYKALDYISNDIKRVDLASADYINTFLNCVKSGKLGSDLSCSNGHLRGFRVFFRDPDGARYWTLPDFTVGLPEYNDALVAIQKFFSSERTNNPSFPREELTDLTVAQDEFLKGAGWGLMIRSGWKMEACNEFIEKLPKKWQPSVMNGIGMGLAYTKDKL